ncbi:MAG: Glycosyltransferase [Parcubacteria group bacterium GW2011_GWE2_39_37]|nr:MAG: Glycosyltransferase [Parcubacteria group bacterium GW2011_GWE2_39_37]
MHFLSKHKIYPMPKNILITDTVASNIKFVKILIEELGKKNFNFSLASSNKQNGLSGFFKQQEKKIVKFFFGPNLDGNNYLNYASFLTALIPLLLINFFNLAYLKFKKRIDTIICLGLNDKIIITPLARILGIKVLWLELPPINIEARSFWLIKFMSRFANIAVFNSYNKALLGRAGINEDSVTILQPGININQFKFQENIFSTLAHAEQTQKKFFSIGTIVDLDQQEKIESLFQAVKKCLTIISNMQIIIIGEGKEKKNLMWLAKKMEIESLVWFVGEQAHLRKWLDGLDIYAVTTEQLKINDLLTTLEAMAAELPVIGQYEAGLEDAIFDEKSGSLLKFDDSEMLAQKIIKLHQDKHYRERLGKAGRERVEKYFNSAKMLEQLEKML